MQISSDGKHFTLKGEKDGANKTLDADQTELFSPEDTRCNRACIEESYARYGAHGHL